MTTTDTIRALDALRARHGATSEIGGHTSNLIEQIINHQESRGEQRARLEQFMASSVAQIARLTASDPIERGLPALAISVCA